MKKRSIKKLNKLETKMCARRGFRNSNIDSSKGLPEIESEHKFSFRSLTNQIKEKKNLGDPRIILKAWPIILRSK
ncbi:MAG: hypothetical protein ACFFDN_01325 [Candidatus Hodarchaeota archaeon]